MDTLLFLQHYWWFLISLLGALLVFLLFVQGGQGLLYTMGRTEAERDLVVNALGRKWEFTFTTLVTFGGAFFASFPLFYSTSFGGAFYVWMAILLVFVVQAVSYEYRRKPSNVLGQRTYEAFLVLNGVAGPLLLGVAVGTFFTGAEFTVNRMNMAAVGGDTAISQWATPWHGLEALTDARNLLLGVAVFALSRVLALHFFLNNLDDETLRLRARRLSCGYSLLFLAAFLAFFGWLLCSDGRAIDPASGTVSIEPYKYLHNLLAMPAVAIVLLAGVAAVLWGLWSGGQPAGDLVQRRGNDPHGAGTAAAGGLERYLLLPVADGHAVFAGDHQQFVESLHTQSDERRLAADPLRRGLHLVCVEGVDPPDLGTRGRGGGTQILIGKGIPFMEIVSLRESPQEVERFIAYFQSRWANVTTREANGRASTESNRDRRQPRGKAVVQRRPFRSRTMILRRRTDQPKWPISSPSRKYSPCE